MITWTGSFAYEIDEFKVGWRDELANVRLSIDYSVGAYWRGNETSPPEGGEVELDQITVTGADIGEDMRPAGPFELKLIQDAIDKDGDLLDKLRTEAEEHARVHGMPEPDYD